MLGRIKDQRDVVMHHAFMFGHLAFFDAECPFIEPKACKKNPAYAESVQHNVALTEDEFSCDASSSIR